MTRNNRYILIYVLTFILPVLIIFIHFPFVTRFNIYIDAIARIGVPFFFMVSGYFCVKIKFNKILGKTIKFIFIAVITSIACVFIKVYWWQNINDVIFWVNQHLNMNEFWKFLLFNELFFERHLWFLFALLYCYWIFFVFDKLKIIKRIYCLIPILLSINILINYLLPCFNINIEIYWTRNFLLTGIPFFLIGNFLRANKLKIPNNIMLIVFIIGLIISCFDVKTLGGKDLYIGTICASVSLFSLAINNRIKIKENIPTILGISSSIIYYLHIPLGDMISAYNSWHYIIPIDFYNKFRPVIISFITIIISVFISIIYYRLMCKKRIKKAIVKNC